MDPTQGWLKIAYYVLFFGGYGLFTYYLTLNFRLLKFAKPINRFEDATTRLYNTILFAFGQKRILKDTQTGLMHAFIFWGFLVLLFRFFVIFGKGFSHTFLDTFLNSQIGYYYTFMKDIFVVLIIIMVTYAAIRRLFIKPKRVDFSIPALLILTFIFTAMVTDIFLDATEFYVPGAKMAFLGNTVSTLFANFTMNERELVYTIAWWIHAIVETTLIIMLTRLYLSKHFHVITAIPNVYFQNLETSGVIENVENLEELFESDDEDIPLGVSKITDLNWKQYLDLFSCTECGRCHEFCPTFLTDKPLSPKRLNDNLKKFLYDNQKNILKGKANELPDIIGDVVTEDEIWDCTTCGRCEEACPIFIENIPRIIDMRRKLVMVDSKFPSELQTAFTGMERNGNPWNFGMNKRFEWAEGLEIPTMAEVENPEDIEVLFWVGCAGSFDERGKKITRAFVEIMKKAHVKFACLGEEEGCCGDFARRSGEEYLYQTLAQQNVETLNEYKIKNIVTICPHGFNTMKHEYKEFGGHYNVCHHTEFIAKLIKDKKIDLSSEIKKKITYHDSCYLGRHNKIYDEPRDILESIKGVELKEPSLNMENGLCCGAGGGRMFMEESRGTRINHKRFEDIKETANPEEICTACPFCITMLTDATKDTGNENITTRDIAEIVAEAIK